MNNVADVFSMGKLHKDLATTMLASAQDDNKPDQLVIKVAHHIACIVFANAFIHCMMHSNGTSEHISLV